MATPSGLPPVDSGISSLLDGFKELTMRPHKKKESSKKSGQLFSSVTIVPVKSASKITLPTFFADKKIKNRDLRARPLSNLHVPKQSSSKIKREVVVWRFRNEPKKASISAYIDKLAIAAAGAAAVSPKYPFKDRCAFIVKYIDGSKKFKEILINDIVYLKSKSLKDIKKDVHEIFIKNMAQFKAESEFENQLKISLDGFLGTIDKELDEYKKPSK